MKLEDAEELVRSPSESRNVEVKRWIDPANPKNQAKIIKCLHALRNFNGGYLVIGFDDKTGKPDTSNIPNNVRDDYHQDKIQKLVSEYSSDPFAVDVQYPERENQEFVVIEVSSGVEAPVAVKKDIVDSENMKLVSCNDVYFRTLSANHTVSSARVPYKDWPDVMEICFNNHEAKIGRFLRRHLKQETLESFCRGFKFKEPSPSISNEVNKLLDEGRKRYREEISGRTDLPRFGTFEVGLIISGLVPPHIADKNFRHLLDRNNPQLNGWPIWLDSSGFRDTQSHPYPMKDRWESLIILLDDDWGGGHVDFMQKKVNGHFYLLRGLQDDLTKSHRGPKPNTELDFGISILRTAEAISVGRVFALALGCDPEEAQLEFGFRWSGLKGRMLTSWASPERSLSRHLTAKENEIICRTTVPLFSSPENITEATYQVVSEVFALFDGYIIDLSVVDDLVRRLLERRI